jgi:signal transduction histidine kinase
LELADLAAENHAQRELLETVFSADPGGLAVLVGEDLIHQYVNPAYRSMLPSPDADPLGRRYAEVWPQEDNFRGQWMIQRVLKSGNSFQLDRYPQEYANGVTRYYSLKLRPINWNDQPGVLIALWDVTEVEDAHQAAERAAEEARLNAQEAQEGRDILQALLDYAPEGIAIASKETGQIKYVSRYGKMMASVPWSEKRPVDMETLHKIWRLVHLDGKTRADAAEMPLRRAMEYGEIILNEEWRVELSNGEAPFISCSAGPIRSPAQQIVGALITWQDITERKMAEAALAENASRLEHSNRELEQFAFVASHDLQEPLRKIQLFGGLLMDAAAGKNQGVDTADLLKRMINASQRMQNMINGLLSLSRVSTRGQPPSRLDLNQLVDDVLQDLEVSITRTHGQVEVEELPALEADPLQMRQLMLNLIGNALKYHRPDTPPRVRVRGEKVQMPGARNLPGVRILVEDNGIGFENEYVERIFQPFERLHGRGEYEGTGMGLAICQKIVERHHGSITAVSAPDQGATFIVTLPEKQG